MKKRKISKPLISYFTFFFLVAAIVLVAVFVYGNLLDRLAGNRVLMFVTMLMMVIVLSLICAVVDFLYQRVMVGKTVKKILDTTDKIAAGDFGVRLEVTHQLRRYNELDYIIENLNKMAAELSRTEVLHTDFISNVSHELKTPLAIIQNYAASLLYEKDEEMRKKYALTLIEASQRLSQLISNILKLNKLDNQMIKPASERVNLTEALSEAVLGFEELIETKQLELSCDFDDDVMVYSVPSYLEILWNNLLSNAIKFTEPGGNIAVSLKASEGKAVVSVTDTGCGISSDTGRYIFERFYQGDTSHTGEGNGLGLALVKKVIDTIGGTISVESEVDKGTTFSVTLNSLCE